MNLYIEELSKYLIEETEQILSANSEKEARFILQSLSHFDTFRLFEKLEAYTLRLQKKHRVKVYLKVATRLWKDWCLRCGEVEIDKVMSKLGAINSDGSRKWIDDQDRLTWYRNKTTKSEDTEILFVVLVGLSHATDQGGLADFHVVDENRIYNHMGGSLRPWIEDINDHLDLNAGESDINNFNLALQELFKLRPLQMEKFAGVMEKLADIGYYSNFRDFLKQFFLQLPSWGIPPLAADCRNDLFGVKGKNYIAFSEEFISHKRYMSPSSQKKDWKKIFEALSAPDFEVPERIDQNLQQYTLEQYSDTLKKFIFEADYESREELLGIDLLPIVRILLRRGSKVPDKKTIPKIIGFSHDVFFQGAWRTLAEYSKEFDFAHNNDLASIHIKIEHFEHDIFTDNDSEGDGDEQAKRLLRGCLGGFAQEINTLECCLPTDQEQSKLSRDKWEKQIPMAFEFDLEGVTCKMSRKSPSIKFRVALLDINGETLTSNCYKWRFDALHPERISFECARAIQNKWNREKAPNRTLPAFKIPSDHMTAIYYSVDVEEANRLVAQAQTHLKLINLLEDVRSHNVGPALWALVVELIKTYRDWLDTYISSGFYAARQKALPRLITVFEDLSIESLSTDVPGASDILRRAYKAFFILDESAKENDTYISSAIVWGLSPAVLEIVHARILFLREGFSELAADLLLGRAKQKDFERLLDLAKIQRPLAVLVSEPGGSLAAEVKSFGLIHYYGAEPQKAKSLAVQTLLRDQDREDDTQEITRPCEERELVIDVIENYQKLYPSSHDGMNILASNVSNLQVVLSGVDKFLEMYLIESSDDLAPFSCSIMVYSTFSSPLAIEQRLASWRETVLYRHREKGRRLRLTVSHRFAPYSKLEKVLKNDENQYDIGFLFHFLRSELVGTAFPAAPYNYDFSGWGGVHFPIAEYPRPIDESDLAVRQHLLSNRQFRIQSRHADMSARLRSANATKDHVIYGQINFKKWRIPVNLLHEKANWVACVDSFVDKRLLSDEGAADRKIVGFASGLGTYGELNLTLSTERDSLKELTQAVHNRLKILFPHEDPPLFEDISPKIVEEAEEIIGLSSLRAVVGIDESIRDVIGFAGIHKALERPNGVLSQLVPLDSLRHWFSGRSNNMRPDLLQLSLELRDDEIPIIYASLIECKLGQYSEAHVNKACEQLQEGLKHLIPLLSPLINNTNISGFDRRYWWAQLYRAITSRSVVNLSDDERKSLDFALEKVSEGDYEIRWSAVAFTFWTDISKSTAGIEQKTVLGLDSIAASGVNDFTLSHVQIGYDDFLKLFGFGHRTVPHGPKDIVLSSQSGDPEGKSLSQVDTNKASASQKSDLVVNVRCVPDVDMADQGILGDVVLPSGEKPSAFVSSEGTGNEKLERIIKENSILTTVNDSHFDDLEIEIDTIKPQNSTEGVVKNTKTSVPDRILLGTRKNGHPVYWHFGHSKLPNRHILMFGTSGSGKTYAIQCLLAELAQQALHSLVIDYTDGFLPRQIEELFQEYGTPEHHFVVTDKIPLNPFRKQIQVIDPSIPPVEEGAYAVAARISSVFSSVFEVGTQQFAALRRVLQAGVESGAGYSFLEMLDDLREDGTSGESLASKLEPFVLAEPFRMEEEAAWESMLMSPNKFTHIVQLSGLAREVQKMVTEFSLWDLWDFAQNSGDKNKPIPVVLDEIQNLDHSSDSPIDKMLREGRKFGFAMILATQTTSQFNAEQRDRLFQAGHKLFFKPATTELDRFARMLEQATVGISKQEWVSRLSSLEKGQCWSLGPVVKSDGSISEEAVLVNITAFDLRFNQAQ